MRARRFVLTLSAIILLLITGFLGFGIPIQSSASSYTPQSQGAPAYIFPETGKTLSGRFLQYWNEHGGLAQQGYPISDAMSELSTFDGKIYTVQYFERAVFELHPEYQAPNDVLLSLVGAFVYNQRYPAGAPSQVANTLPRSMFFEATGKRLGGTFLDYWTNHGGLVQQGYPISDEFIEISQANGQPYMVQYFERAEFEYHPELTTIEKVLLSQLGTVQYKQKYPQGPVSAPTSPASARPTQPPPAQPTLAPTQTSTPVPSEPGVTYSGGGYDYKTPAFSLLGGDYKADWTGKDTGKYGCYNGLVFRSTDTSKFVWEDISDKMVGSGDTAQGSTLLKGVKAGEYYVAVYSTCEWSVSIYPANSQQPPAAQPTSTATSVAGSPPSQPTEEPEPTNTRGSAPPPRATSTPRPPATATTPPSGGTRCGAVCNDGTTSGATGSGACSHHGGVNYWLYCDLRP